MNTMQEILAASAPSNPHKGIKFVTPYDGM